MTPPKTPKKNVTKTDKGEPAADAEEDFDTPAMVRLVPPSKSPLKSILVQLGLERPDFLPPFQGEPGALEIVDEFTSRIEDLGEATPINPKKTLPAKKTAPAKQTAPATQTAPAKATGRKSTESVDVQTPLPTGEPAAAAANKNSSKIKLSFNPKNGKEAPGEPFTRAPLPGDEVDLSSPPPATPTTPTPVVDKAADVPAPTGSTTTSTKPRGGKSGARGRGRKI